MAKRDPDFRKDVLALDGYRCVICGFNGEDEEYVGFLQTDHVSPRGSGGDPTKDDRKNGMTLCSKCHSLKTDEIIQIKDNEWDRNDKENGLTVFQNGTIRGRDTLWFYIKHDKELLEQSIDALSAMASSEAHRAKILAFVWEHYSLSGDSKSPQQLVAGLGLDPNQSEKEARAYAQLESLGLEWNDGVNYSKIELILSALEGKSSLTVEEDAKYTEILLQARSASFTDLKKDFVEDGLIEPNGNGSSKEKLYVTCSKDDFFKHCRPVFAKEGGIPLDDNQILLRVDKVYSPMRKRAGRVFVMNGLIEEEVKTDGYPATT